MAREAGSIVASDGGASPCAGFGRRCRRSPRNPGATVPEREPGLEDATGRGVGHDELESTRPGRSPAGAPERTTAMGPRRARSRAVARSKIATAARTSARWRRPRVMPCSTGRDAAEFGLGVRHCGSGRRLDHDERAAALGVRPDVDLRRLDAERRERGANPGDGPCRAEAPGAGASWPVRATPSRRRGGGSRPPPGRDGAAGRPSSAGRAGPSRHGCGKIHRVLVDAGDLAARQDEQVVGIGANHVAHRVDDRAIRARRHSPGVAPPTARRRRRSAGARPDVVAESLASSAREVVMADLTASVNSCHIRARRGDCDPSMPARSWVGRGYVDVVQGRASRRYG